MRSVMLSAVSILPAAPATIAGVAPVAASRSRATLRKRAAAGARRVGRVTAGHRHAFVDRGRAPGPSRSPMPRRSAVRARKIASGSMSRPISRARSPSPGGTKAKRDEGRLQRRVLEHAPPAPPSACRRCVGASPARNAATLSISSRIEMVCSACQRLNGSLSCAARKARSSAVRSVTSLIGAEKPRLIDKHRPLRDAGERERLRRLRSAPARRARSASPFVSFSGRSVPSLPTRPSDERDDHRLFRRLAGRRRQRFADVERIGFALPRRSRL